MSCLKEVQALQYISSENGNQIFNGADKVLKSGFQQAYYYENKSDFPYDTKLVGSIRFLL